LTTLKVKVVDTNLQKKGFVRNEKSDHIRYILYVNGVKTVISTKISHGEKEIGDPLIAHMSNQLLLSKSDFVDLVSCKIDGEQYLAMVDEYIDSPCH